MNNSEVLEALKKIAIGYEYEEIQTSVHESEKGVDKRVVRNKKHYPPNFQAIQYILNKKNNDKSLDEEMKKLNEDLTKLMEDEKWKL